MPVVGHSILGEDCGETNPADALICSIPPWFARSPRHSALLFVAGVWDLAMVKTATLSLALLLADRASAFVGSGLASPSLKLACRTSSDRPSCGLSPAGRRDPTERLLYRASSDDCELSWDEEERRHQVGASMGFLAAALRPCAYLTVLKIDT